jgi:hypothetical protein
MAAIDQFNQAPASTSLGDDTLLTHAPRPTMIRPSTKSPFSSGPLRKEW